MAEYLLIARSRHPIPRAVALLATASSPMLRPFPQNALILLSSLFYMENLLLARIPTLLHCFGSSPCQRPALCQRTATHPRQSLTKSRIACDDNPVSQDLSCQIGSPTASSQPEPLKPVHDVDGTTHKWKSNTDCPVRAFSTDSKHRRDLSRNSNMDRKHESATSKSSHALSYNFAQQDCKP